MSEARLSDKAIVIHPDDNVAVAKATIGKGTLLSSNGTRLLVTQTVQPGHKIALKGIASGETVLRYGEVIGLATSPIPQGGTVHYHNMVPDTRGRRKATEIDPKPVRFRLSSQVPSFQGYQREWGGVGTRNYVVVLSTVICSSHPSQLIARHFEQRFQDDPHFDGVIPITHQEGCGGEKGEDIAQLMRVYNGIMYHPNVAAVLVVGLGCEESNVECVQGCHSSLPLQLQTHTRGRVRYLTIQGAGGTTPTVKQGIEIVEELVERAAHQRLRQTPAAGSSVRGIGCLLGHIGQPGAGTGQRPDRQLRRHYRVAGDPGDLWGGTPADEGGGLQPGRRGPVANSGALQGLRGCPGRRTG